MQFFLDAANVDDVRRGALRGVWNVLMAVS
jgi:hypothetical protein